MHNNLFYPAEFPYKPTFSLIQVYITHNRTVSHLYITKIKTTNAKILHKADKFQIIKIYVDSYTCLVSMLAFLDINKSINE